MMLDWYSPTTTAHPMFIMLALRPHKCTLWGRGKGRSTTGRSTALMSNRKVQRDAPHFSYPPHSVLPVRTRPFMRIRVHFVFFHSLCVLQRNILLRTEPCVSCPRPVGTSNPLQSFSRRNTQLTSYTCHVTRAFETSCGQLTSWLFSASCHHLVSSSALLALTSDGSNLLEMFALARRNGDPPPTLEPWSGGYAGLYLTIGAESYSSLPDPRLKSCLDTAVQRLLSHRTPYGYIGPWPTAFEVRVMHQSDCCRRTRTCVCVCVCVCVCLVVLFSACNLIPWKFLRMQLELYHSSLMKHANHSVRCECTRSSLCSSNATRPMLRCLGTCGATIK